MPDRGADLGADLDKLYRIASVNLPDVANEYRKAADQIVAAELSMAGAFNRGASFGGPYGPVYRPWEELLFAVGKFLGDTSDNLADTAKALMLAVHGYAEADDAARIEFERLRTQHGPE